MTEYPFPAAPVPGPPTPPRRRRSAVKIVGICVGGVVALLLGIGIIGAAFGTPKTTTQTRTVAANPAVVTATATRTELVPGPLTTTITTVQVPAPGPAVTSTAVTRVPVPGPTRTVQVRVTYTPPVAAAFGDGTQVVGTDIQPGVYHSDGHGDLGSCYWARLKSLTTSDIIDNGNISGPTTIQVQSGDKALETSGGCTWSKTG